MRRSLFITMEGTDGSGKTTQLGFIRDYLKARGCNVLFTREPGGTGISESIRSVILDTGHTGMDSHTEMFLYAAARAQLVAETIRPSLESGIIVICDRYVDSTYAYQGYGRGISMDTLEKVNSIAIAGVMPDVTFFLDIDPETALKRRMAATASDRMENEEIEFHKRVYNGYLKLVGKYPERIRRIDGRRPTDVIWTDVRNILESMLEYNKYILGR